MTASVKILTKKNGPFIVTGEVDIVDGDGNPVATKQSCALCRCGASSIKPFCDGTHTKIGFQSAAQVNPASKE